MPVQLQLPELEEPPLLGASLVRHPGRLTLCILALFAAATYAALSWVRIDVAIEATGTLELGTVDLGTVDLGTVELGSDETDRWLANLWVAPADINRIHPGDTAKIRIPALIAESGASGSWTGVVTEILGGPEKGKELGEAFRVTIELDPPRQQSGLDTLRRGMTVNGRVITRSATASELIWRTVERRRSSNAG